MNFPLKSTKRFCSTYPWLRPSGEKQELLLSTVICRVSLPWTNL